MQRVVSFNQVVIETEEKMDVEVLVTLSLWEQLISNSFIQFKLYKVFFMQQQHEVLYRFKTI